MATFLKPDKQTTVNGVTLNEYLLTNHNPKKIDMPSTALTNLIGITVHNTDTISVPSGTTMAETYTRATVNGNMKTVRVHYYVDYKGIWQNLPLTLSGWHAADGNGDGNRKTISIECIMSSKYTDQDKLAEDNCARLVAWLLKKYNMTVEKNLYTHTHWLAVKAGKSGDKETLNQMKGLAKWCPAYILPHWSSFETKVKTYLNALTVAASSTAKTTTAKTTTSSTVKEVNYVVSLKATDNIYKNAPGNDFTVVKTIGKASKYTIIKECLVNNKKYGYLKSGAGWVLLSANVTTTTTTSSTTAQKTYTCGQAVKLTNCPLYTSAAATTSKVKKTGTFYIYNTTITNNRIRITTKAENADKKPVGSYVTGWINLSDIK